MIPLGQDIGFIVAAYAGVGIGVVALIGYAVFDARRVRAHLKALEAQGMRRRSDASPTGGIRG